MHTGVHMMAKTENKVCDELSDLGAEILYVYGLKRGKRSGNQWFLCPGVL